MYFYTTAYQFLPLIDTGGAWASGDPSSSHQYWGGCSSNSYFSSRLSWGLLLQWTLTLFFQVHLGLVEPVGLVVTGVEAKGGWRERVLLPGCWECWGWGTRAYWAGSLSWVSDTLILLFKESNTKGRSMSSSAFMSLILYYSLQFYDQFPGKSNLERKSFL